VPTTQQGLAWRSVMKDVVMVYLPTGVVDQGKIWHVWKHAVKCTDLLWLASVFWYMACQISTLFMTLSSLQGHLIRLILILLICGKNLLCKNDGTYLVFGFFIVLTSSQLRPAHYAW